MRLFRKKNTSVIGEKKDIPLILIMLLHMFFANSNLNIVQILLEVILLTLFIVRLRHKTFSFHEISIFHFFIFGSCISFLMNPIEIFLINFKIFGLAILTLIYFSKVHIRPDVIGIVFLVNLFFIFQQVFWGEHLASPIIREIGGYFGSEVYMNARPLGVFMNTHQSSFFMALCLIYYGLKNRLYGVGIIALYYSGSFFTLVSYIAQLVKNNKIWQLIPRVLYKILMSAFLLFLFVIIVIMLNAAFLVETLASYDFDFLHGLFPAHRIHGIQVIIQQVFDHDLLVKLLSIYPLDSNTIVEGREAMGLMGNEVAYFRYIFQSGIILFALYFIYLLKRIKYFRAFLIVSLLHYGDLVTPLIIFMMITFSRTVETSKSSVMLPAPLSQSSPWTHRIGPLKV